MPSNAKMINALIDSYESIQRIKTAKNAEKEMDYQLRLIKAKLQAFGVITDDLDKEKED